jgi:hypothetical protein
MYITNSSSTDRRRKYVEFRRTRPGERQSYRMTMTECNVSNERPDIETEEDSRILMATLTEQPNSTEQSPS